MEVQLMKKLLLSTMIIGVLAGNAFPLQFGLEYMTGAQSIIGTNLRINDVFEFKPQLGFSFSDPGSNLQLILNGNYYFTESSGLQQYAGGALDMVFGDNVFGQDISNIMINGHYGMRYDINEVLSLFGELGINMDFDPFVLSTFTGGMGLTIFIP